MVVHEQNKDAVDRTFQALADATRRDILRRVGHSRHSVSELAALYSMSFAAVQKHVAVLERAELVTKEKRGREQLVTVNPQGLDPVRHLLEEYGRLWRQRMDGVAALLAGPLDNDGGEN